MSGPDRPPPPEGLHGDWWRCLRRGPVSGRYEGADASRAIELRVDIDPRSTDSPVLDRISADEYRVISLPRPGGQPFVSRSHERSWVIDEPQVTWFRCEVVITGTVRHYGAGQPATTATITIGWTTMQPAGPAQVALSTGWSVSCRRISDTFRDITLEVDRCSSVDAVPFLPGYDTHNHPDRPSGLTRRTLGVPEAYVEAGVGVGLMAASIIDDSAARFTSWSDAELHDAMETAFSTWGQGWPAWRMWGLLAAGYDDPLTGGIMFDYRATENPQRQGFAVFRDHSWFTDLPDGAPTNDAEAAALRTFLYTYVHEAGHAFNLVHSWDKARPDALSWMNYDWRYDRRPGNTTGDFWRRFDLRFDDEELLHIRHGDHSSVVMGGDAWASGLHLDAPQTTAAGPLEVLVRTKGTAEQGEPVYAELRLRNLLDAPVLVESNLDPAAGATSIWVRRPDRTTVALHPVTCKVAQPRLVELLPAGSPEGTERYSAETFIGFGSTGQLFDQSGRYLVKAAYHGLGTMVVSASTELVVLPGPDHALAARLTGFEAGLATALGGTCSDHLAEGMAAIRKAASAARPIAARTGTLVARAEARDFHALRTDDNGARLVLTAAADPDAALQVSRKGFEVLQRLPAAQGKPLNLAYRQLVDVRVAAHLAKDEPAAARAELRTLREDLAKRGVNEPILESISAEAERL